MKVLGTDGKGTLICEVSTTELEKFYDVYYGSTDLSNGMKRTIRSLNAGNHMDLGKGHDHLREFQAAFSEMKKFVKANEIVIKGITTGMLLMAANSDKEQTDGLTES